MVHLKIPVWTEKGWRGPEEVEARDLGGGRFVILCPPRFAYGLAVGDEIELVPESPVGFRVTRRSRNLTIWVYAVMKESVSPLAERARQVLPSIGAVLEGTPPAMLIVTAPLDAGWKEIERLMNDLVSAVPGASWEFANVYEVEVE